MGSAIRFKQTNIARQNGEQARLKVVFGPDAGAVYIIMGSKATIGRGEENDVIIADLKASRIHAEIALIETGWIVRDKNSANGILINGAPSREVVLKVNDMITVGGTTLEFITSDQGTQFLVAPPRVANPLQQIADVVKQGSVFSGGISGIRASGESVGKGSQNRTVILLGAVLLFGFLMFGNDTPQKPAEKKRSPEEVRKELAVLLPKDPGEKSAETIFKDGLREYFTGNYSRARTQFETVLQIAPGHILGKLYLENCNMAVDREVKSHLEGGKKALQAGKLRSAKAHFGMVMRLLYRAQSDPAYIEAQEQYQKVLKAMRGEDNP